MEAKEYKIIDILTESKEYLIPTYQRPYTWDRDNTDDLLEDLYSGFMAEGEYFIGTIICIERENYRYEVVDGQQRLTTLSMIFAAMKDIIVTNVKAKTNIEGRVLKVDDFASEVQESRLKVRESEHDLYHHYILQGDSNYCPSSPSDTQRSYIDNFNYIKGYLKDKFEGSEESLCRFAKYILEQVYVVFVTTNDLVSSFRLFNVLNTRGLPLAASDLIKNALFEAAEAKKINLQKIDKYWLEIERIIQESLADSNSDKLNKFLKTSQVSRKRNRDRSSRDLFQEYSNLIQSHQYKSPLEFVVSLRQSAKTYARIKQTEDFSLPEIKKILSSLNRLTDEWVPAILAFLRQSSTDGSLPSETIFLQFLTMFEKCYMQSWMRKQVKNQREAITYTALVAINNGGSLQEIIDAIKSHANNDQFVESLDNNLYTKGAGNINFVKALLLRIDQNIQDNSVYKNYSDKISVEHILPQNLTDQYWRNRFTASQHQEWVHKLGNLTLISGHKNSQASNSSFDTKKRIYNNPQKSLDITREICAYDNWDLSAIKARHEELKLRVIKMWSV